MKNTKNSDNSFEESRAIIFGSRIADLLLEGKKKAEIFTEINQTIKVPLNETDLTNYYIKALEILEERYGQDLPAIKMVHIAHYEEIYAYAQSINHDELMNAALAAKERLLGLHQQEKTTVNRKRKINVAVLNKKSYDMSKLTQEERDRFEYLIKKATVQ